MYQTCGEMFEKTSRVVQEARDSGEEQRKLVEMGKQGEKESLDEFIRRIESVSGGYDVDEEVVMQGMSPGQNGLEYENMEFGFLEADTRMARLAW
jgi:hypothetical protein